MHQAEIDRLARLAGGEDEAVRKLEAAISELRAVKDAQACLRQLPADDLRHALESRHRVLLQVVAA
ncbi:MAG: hypothetical protein GX440_06710 [Propionibacterium sp.]|nr:hypothetical protein [Propionibacterium sp.]